MIIPLGKVRPDASREFGGKAAYLGLMIRQGLPVPEGYVLGTGYFQDLIKRNGKDAAFQELVSEPTVLHRYRKLRKLIMELEFSPEERTRLHEVFDTLGQRVAVRSSAPDEDTRTQSMAGVYVSFTDVIDPAEMCKAVLECYASAFTEFVSVLGHQVELGTAVVIQAYVSFDFGGVAFSCDPVTGNPEHVVLNFVQGGVEAVVSGSGSSRLAVVPKYGNIPPVADIDPDAANQVRALALKLESLLGEPVDLEWGFAATRLYCVQVRPVSTVVKTSGRVPAVLDSDDLTSFVTADLGSIGPLHTRFLEKKYHIRRICRRHGLPVPARYYLIVPPAADGVAQEVARLVSRLQTEFVEVFTCEQSLFLRPEELLATVVELSKGGTAPVAVVVQEYRLTASCGYASVTADGMIYVETLPGTFGGFWLERLLPTVYSLQVGGTVVHEQISDVIEHKEFDKASRSYRTVHLDRPVHHTLTPGVLRQIADLARIFQAELPEVRLEWICDDDTVYLFDLSEESRPLVETTGKGQMLSAGYAEGPACVVSDVTVLDSLFQNELEIDVVPNAEFLAQLESDACQAAVERILGGLNRPIVIAEYPKRPLAALADHAAGFIFERGALLSHLAIMLREKHVPAVVLPGARTHIRHGETIRLVEGQVLQEPVMQGERYGTTPD